MSANTSGLIVILGILLLSLALDVSAADATAPAPFDRQKLAQVPKAMQDFVDKGDIAGAVTLVATKDGVVALDAVGKADIEKDVRMKDDAIFWIASMTKPVTAAAVLMLQDEGKLSIDDPVGKYVPELAHLKTADGKQPTITLKHMLTHTSGMVGEAPDDVLRQAGTLADLMPAYAKYPLNFEPGTKWAYCQSGINTLGRIVEIVSGRPFADFLRERFFEPLGMKDTTFYLSEEQKPRLATSYKLNDGKLEPANIFVLQGHEPTSRRRYPAANGGLFSTARDYARFCQMLLNDGSLDGKQYLKPETARQMRTIQTGGIRTGFTPGNGWGLGVCVVREPQGVTEMLSPGSFGHGGAYGTQAWIDPVKGIVYILMVQRADFPNSDDSPVRKAFQEAAAEALATGN
jgi:CubicO group peptidase (beta-lactamase class C family)